MGRLGLLGAGLVVGLGLDCASAARYARATSDDPPDRGEETSTLIATLVAPSGAEPDQEHDGPQLEALPPGTRYASLSNDACAGELVVRGVAHEALAARRGIASPVRLHGPLSGVSFRTLWPEPERARTSFEIIDCRLVLALDDFAKLLRAREIVEVMFFSAYRPPPAGWSEAASARHEGGLAIDVAYFRKSDGSALNVERDFHPRARERICTDGLPPRDATFGAVELRQIACEAASAQLFHLTLTPAYDHTHRDHFHLELSKDKTDFVAR